MIGVGELRTGVDYTPSTITMSVLEDSLSISLSAPNSLEYAHDLAVSTSGNPRTLRSVLKAMLREVSRRQICI